MREEPITTKLRQLPAVPQHSIKHIWEQYSKEYLLKHPDCFGKYHNKTKNYYIFRNGTKSRTLRLEFPSGVTMPKIYSMSGLVFSYEQFRDIIVTYLQKAVTAIINGEALKIKHLGTIVMIRVERDFRKTKQLKVDWGKTSKQEKIWSEEKQKFVVPKYIYHTDDDWCRIAWFKSRIRNDSVYEFTPTRQNSKGEGGFIGELTRRITADKYLKFKYLFRPIRDIEDVRPRKPYTKQDNG